MKDTNCYTLPEEERIINAPTIKVNPSEFVSLRWLHSDVNKASEISENLTKMLTKSVEKLMLKTLVKEIRM